MNNVHLKYQYNLLQYCHWTIWYKLCLCGSSGWACIRYIVFALCCHLSPYFLFSYCLPPKCKSNIFVYVTNKFFYSICKKQFNIQEAIYKNLGEFVFLSSIILDQNNVYLCKNHLCVIKTICPFLWVQSPNQGSVHIVVQAVFPRWIVEACQGHWRKR